MKGRLPRWLKRLSAPRRGLPVLLSLALIAAAVGVADIPSVLQRGDMLQPNTFVLTPLLAAVYLAFKGWQFGRLLAASGLETHWRSRWPAFAVGEISLTLPFGMYAQNYILKKSQGTEFAESAASTTLMLALEVGFLVVVLSVVSIPGWPQVRPILWGIVAAGVLAGVCAHRSPRLRSGIRRRAERDNWVGKIAQGMLDFTERLRTIWQPRVLLHNVLITAAYMLALMFAFQHVGDNVSHAHLDFREAITIYSFGLLIAMSLGSVLSQFGVLELSGAAAAQAWGMSLHDGLAILLWFRLLWTGSIWIISGVILATLWKELRRLSLEDD